MAVAVALAAWLGPGLLSDPGSGARPRSGESGSAAPSGSAGPLAADVPVRGNLSGDTGFIAAVLHRVRTDHPDADRVLLAGQLPDGARVALVGRDRDESDGVRALDVYALRVPAGGSVEDGEVTVMGRGLIESSGMHSDRSRRVRA